MPRRWLMLAVLYLGRIAMGFQFQSVASVAAPMAADLGLDNTGIGTLVGLYMLPGLLIAVPGGLLGRRFGDRPSVIGALCLMAAGGAVTALADGFLLAAIGRVASGVGAIVIGVLMIKMVTDWFAGREMITASAIYFAGWPFGIAIGLVSQGSLAEATSWQTVLLLSSALILVAALLLAFAYRDSPDAPPADPGGRLFTLSRRELLLVSLVGLAWAFSTAGYVIVLAFAAAHLQARGYSVAGAGAMVSLQIWISLIAMPVGGWLVERLQRPYAVVCLAFLANGAAVAAIPYTDQVWALFTLLGLIGGLPAGIIIALAAESLAPANRAVGLGVYYTWFYGGMGLAPVVAGMALDLSGDAAAPFLIPLVTALAAVATILLYRRHAAAMPGA